MKMGINPEDLLRLISEVLRGIDLYSPEAVSLLLGTAAVESGLWHRLYQLAGGPARGIYQMEPATEESLWLDFLAYRAPMRIKIHQVTGRSGPGPWLAWDLAYQTVMARVKYRPVPEPLPGVDDIEGQARYWKLYYNTRKGKGNIQNYIEAQNLLRMGV